MNVLTKANRLTFSLFNFLNTFHCGCPWKPETSLMSMVCGLGYSGVKCTRHFPPPSTCTWFGTWNKRNNNYLCGSTLRRKEKLNKKNGPLHLLVFLKCRIMQFIGLHLCTEAVFRIRIRNSFGFPDPDLLLFVRIRILSSVRQKNLERICCLQYCGI
jgi:hypothetical protein